MSFEELQKIRELEQRVAILEEFIKQLKLEQIKRTLTLPKDRKTS